jgi:hypothetical protein
MAEGADGRRLSPRRALIALPLSESFAPKLYLSNKNIFYDA